MTKDSPTRIEIMRELADIRSLCIDHYYEQDDLNHPVSKKFLALGKRISDLADTIAFDRPLDSEPDSKPQSDDMRDEPGRLAH